MFTKEQDFQLVELVCKHGKMEGSRKAALLFGKKTHTCYQRFRKVTKGLEVLCPEVKKGRGDYVDWTEEKINFCRETIASNPHNLEYAFEIISDKIGITITTVKGYWYGWGKDNAKSPICRDNIGYCFMLVGNDGFENRKNISRKKMAELQID